MSTMGAAKASSPADGLSDESTVEDSHAQEEGPDSKPFARLRACERCQRMKVRCEVNGDSQRCKRCHQTNRECVATQPRSKRRRTDRRVTELEQKVDSLTASLLAHGYSEAQEMEGNSAQPSETGADHPMAQDGNGGLASAFPRISSAPQQSRRQKTFHEEIAGWIGSPGNAASIDAVDRRILDAATAYQMFHRYHFEMSQYFPIVTFSSTTKPEYIRSTKPILFHTILAVAAAPIRPDLQYFLVGDITQILADRVICRGEKSLELVQALLVLVTFYQRPKDSKELNFLQIAHAGAIMALDLGLGKRSARKVTDVTISGSITAEAEMRRTWLGCYYMCANMSMALRHPLLIRWSSYIEECLEFFATSENILPYDVWLCDLVRNQHIAEEVSAQFSMDDPASTVSLADPKIKFLLKSFEQQLEKWQPKAAQTDIPQAIIQHFRATTNLYIHEVAVHFNHNIDDFRPPHKLSQDLDNDALEADLVGPTNITSFATCLESIHQTFDAFLSIEMSIIRNLPVLFFVRTVYAAVVLIKMYGIVHAEGSTLGAIYASELKAEYYLNAAVNYLAKAAGEAGQAPVVRAFRFDFEKARAWHEKRRYKIMNRGKPHQILQPQGTPSNANRINSSLYSEPWSTGSQVAPQPGRNASERRLAGQQGSDPFLSNPEQFDFGNLNFSFEELNAMDSLVDNATWTSFLV